VILDKKNEYEKIIIVVKLTEEKKSAKNSTPKKY